MVYPTNSGLFLACGWYDPLGRVENFEMCHLRSLGRVANFKNEAFRNGGIGFDFLVSLKCCTAHAVVWSSGGGWGGGCINVLDEYFPYGTEHVHIAHAVVWSSGGWGGVLTPSCEIWKTLVKTKSLAGCVPFLIGELTHLTQKKTTGYTSWSSNWSSLQSSNVAGKSPVTWQVRWENHRTNCGIFQPCLNTGEHTRFGRSSYIIWAYIICVIYPIVSCSMPTITS